MSNDRLVGPDRVALNALGNEEVAADLVGAALHGYSGLHPAGRTCDACGTTGRARLKHLQELGYVRRKRNGKWVRK